MATTSRCRGALAVPEALQEQVQERTRRRPGLVDRRHQDRLVRRRGAPEQVRQVMLGRVLFIMLGIRINIIWCAMNNLVLFLCYDPKRVL
jgi:hypothetical protein